ncbi:MAG: acyl-CoA dehydrogenase family protein [Rubrivivax sp.]
MALLNEEQTMLHDVAADWAKRRAPITAFRKLRDQGGGAGYDAEAWREIAGLGWPGIAVPDAYGGAGMGVFEVGLVVEQLGRTLAAQPLASTALVGVRALVRAGSTALQAMLLPEVAAGDVRLALAIDEGARFDPARLELDIVPGTDGVRLKGQKRFIQDGMAATHFIVFGRGDSGLSAVVVPADAPGLRRRDMGLVDHRGAALLQFDGVEVGGEYVLGELGRAAGLLDESIDAAAVGSAAELLGAAEAALDITLDYMRVRVQFDHPIGSFQALQHRAAEWFAELQLARSSVEAALSALDRGDAKQRSMAASTAKVMMNDASRLATNEMIQLHGGIGMTDEHDAGFFLKRARVLACAYGSTSWHLERLARAEGF